MRNLFRRALPLVSGEAAQEAAPELWVRCGRCREMLYAREAAKKAKVLVKELKPILTVEEAMEAGYQGDFTQHTAPLASTYFNMRKTTIYGGSNEVQRNIVAQTVLG